ncbi:hypothetical protein [Streptomyces sp. NPDC048340]|uniref:hypothetical protein n=1 Tax=Streptomyces sp. NPDC048340 TaxID=3365537 RepID=UPI00371EAECD
MISEHWISFALPYSAAASSKFHVSLYITPLLDPGHEGAVLSEFAVFPDWAQTIKTALGIELRDQNGPLVCTPQRDPVDPAAWRGLFTHDTPVRRPAQPDWIGRRWRSFDARYVHDAAKALHLAAMLASPTDPPTPTGHPATADVIRLARQFEALGAGEDGDARRKYDEQRVTAALDKDTEHQRELKQLEEHVARLSGWHRLAAELHRCRRYYERPEGQHPYQPRPDPNAHTPEIDTPLPEFHERCAMVGDHPALLRALGLVIDLKVAEADLPRLRQAQYLTALVDSTGGARHCHPTRVNCALGDHDALLTVPQDAASDWLAGGLRVGNPQLFSVLDVDADGSALKTDRFLWTLPRLLRIEGEADAVNAAPPALRAGGFTVVRTGRARNTQARIKRQGALEQLLGTPTPTVLYTEDVVRGVRVEVWDGTTRQWTSLHRRVVDAEVPGHGPLLTAREETAFIQGTAADETPNVTDSPIHVHEAVFGWEGWSLSAPRPGRLLVRENGQEVVRDPDPHPPAADLTHPLLITTKVAPGTLPRLRYGRSYAFRAWAVDLAGNSRPPRPSAALGSGQGDDGPSREELVHVLDRLLAGPARPAGSDDADEEREGVAELLREATLRVLDGPGAGEPPPEPGPAELGLAELGLAQVVLPEGGFPEAGPAEAGLAELGLTEPVLARLRERRPLGNPPAPATRTVRHSVIEEAIAAALRDRGQPFLAGAGSRSAAQLADMMAAELGMRPGDGRAPTAEEAASTAYETITAQYPFLRWDPVIAPAPVPRDRYTEGESLRVLVVRSGVSQDPDTLDITVTTPAAYASSVQAAYPALDLRYHGTSERHLAPPKTSQTQAELHGMFDRAIGSTDPADLRAMLGWALRENGSFLDLDVADLDHPSQRVLQPAVRLEHQPGTPDGNVTLPLASPGDPLPSGHYVVHDVDDLVLPYLPDPLAHGIAVVFPDAGEGTGIGFPFRSEGFTAAYGGTWPALQPFRLVLGGGAELSASVTGRVLDFRLPAGDVQRFRLSSSVATDRLKLLGPWGSLPEEVRNNPAVAETAADGCLWGLTPFEDVLLVHAVPRPLEVPRPTIVRPSRRVGETSVTLFGGVDVHGPSTDSLTAEACWTDRIDDVSVPRDEERQATAVAFTTHIAPDEDLALLAAGDGPANASPPALLRSHRAVHEFGDTRHRKVTYRFRATTRFREYFHEELLAAAPKLPPANSARAHDDGRSVVGPPVVVSVPSSAPPAAPMVHSVIPLFRWSDATDTEQPMARRHGRRAGVRVYLERPWWSSGDGELLGLLLSGASQEGEFPFVSRWGADPAWTGGTIARRALEPLRLDNLARYFGFDDRGRPGRPVTAPKLLPLPDPSSRPQSVIVVCYQPQYNAERQLWYVDVALDPGSVSWAFVRLAVARYQPDSVDGCHLSPPVLCDFVQLPPERTLRVGRTDDRHVRVVVSGPVGTREPLDGEATPESLAEAIGTNRTLIARLQRRMPGIDSDLGWATVTTEPLTGQGFGADPFEYAWLAELDAGTTVPLRRPEEPSDWRVMVEEWERLPGDPPAPADTSGPVFLNRRVWEERLVYADEIAL